MNPTDGAADCPFQARSAAPTLPAIDFFDPAFKADPHPAYARLRKHAPVHEVTQRDGRRMWLVTRHEDVLKVLKDTRFVKNLHSVLSTEEIARQPRLPDVMRHLFSHMLSVDPPQHTRLRRLVMQAFSPRLVAGLRPRVQAIADALLDRVLPQGEMELICDYAFPLPITVIGELLGVPSADHALLREWSAVLIANFGVRDEAAIAALSSAVGSLANYLRKLFEHKRATPADDLITRLLQAGEDSEQLDEDELIAMLLLLIVAGHETTTNLIGNGTLALLQHPAQRARLAQDASLLPQAIEELLRYDTPVETSTLRYASEDLSLSGASLRRGDVVMVILTSANRDAERFAQPDMLEIGRDASGHLAFGHGIHFCLGASLARLEGEIAIGTLLRRAPALRLALPPHELRWRLSPLTRGLAALPLVFDPQPVAAASHAARAPAHPDAATAGICPLHRVAANEPAVMEAQR